MTELLTAAQMRAIEEAAIASGEVTGLQLMERAGRGVVEAILDWRPELATAPHRAVVLCGPGNNGGDGFVVARLLRERGWEVEVFLYGDEPKLPPDAAENCRRWREMSDICPASEVVDWTDWCDIFVDAVFGTGLTRSIGREGEDFWEELFCDPREICDDRFMVSVDMPSGVCSDSGRVIGVGSFVADLTVTFHRQRVGHYLGNFLCTRAVVVKDIGLERFDQMLDVGRGYGTGGVVELIGTFESQLEDIDYNMDADIFLARIDRTFGIRKGTAGHKYDHGHAIILAGGVGKGGAARLAARGALRVGAGLVTVCPPPAAIIENAAQLNAIMLRPVADADALAEILKDERLNAVGLGPGLGVGAHTLGLVAATLAAKRGTVLDADALTSFAEDPAKLFALTHEKCVLTPHMGEFARLFPDLAEKLSAPATKGPAYSKVDAAREAAARTGCVILLKGADTVIADPEGRAAINSAHYERAAPWLATAGSGDVLTGMITGLLARGFDPMTAAQTAAWLHVEAARKFGPGLIAEDIPEQLPAVFRDLDL